MKDNTPHKPRPLYSPWPIFVLILFAGAAISIWSSSHVLALVVGAIGVAVYIGMDKARTKMMSEELSFRELFRNW